MKAWILVGVFFLIVPVQTTLANSVAINGLKPDLGFLLVYFLGYFRGSRLGFLGGAGLGLFYDLMFGGPFGMNIISKSFSGIGAGLLGRIFLNPSGPTTMALILGLSVLVGFVNFSYHQTVVGGMIPGEAFRWIILPESLYNSILGGIIYWVGVARRTGRSPAALH